MDCKNREDCNRLCFRWRIVRRSARRLDERFPSRNSDTAITAADYVSRCSAAGLFSCLSSRDFAGVAVNYYHRMRLLYWLRLSSRDSGDARAAGVIFLLSPAIGRAEYNFPRLSRAKVTVIKDELVTIFVQYKL